MHGFFDVIHWSQWCYKSGFFLLDRIHVYKIIQHIMLSYKMYWTFYEKALNDWLAVINMVLPYILIWCKFLGITYYISFGYPYVPIMHFGYRNTCGWWRGSFWSHIWGDNVFWKQRWHFICSDQHTRSKISCWPTFCVSRFWFLWGFSLRPRVLWL